MSRDEQFGAPEDRDAAPRRLLAQRLAERNHQRALRAERLARLRPQEAAEEAGTTAGVGTDSATGAEPMMAEPAMMADPVVAAESALEAFLRALTGDRPAPAPLSPEEPGTLLAFPGGARGPGSESAAGVSLSAGPASGDLHRLPGAGPGLVWALERAGIRNLADLAGFGPPELSARLGPLGRLVPAAAWIAVARDVTGLQETVPV